jgi:fluoroquinolone transport system permease protein
MFVLEDREQGVLTAFRVSPLSPGRYLVYRGLTAFVFALLATVPAIAVVGIVTVPLPVLIGAATVGALGGPVLALGFGTVANNTIEGIALSKLINLVVLGPALVIAVLPEPIQFVGGISPTYWPVKAVVAALGGDPAWPFYLVGGVVSHGIALIVLLWWFGKRVD